MSLRERQKEYYKVLGECDRTADSSRFIEFMLATVFDALQEIASTDQVTVQVTVQVKKLLQVMSQKEYSAKELMALVGLKHRPSFRDNYLLPALKLGFIEMTLPDKPNSSLQKYYKT